MFYVAAIHTAFNTLQQPPKALHAPGREQKFFIAEKIISCFVGLACFE